MSVIPTPPVQVCWRIGHLDYAMMQVRPSELARIKKDYPDIEGIPTYYAIVEDDVDWWPSSEEGEPVVVMGHDLPPARAEFGG